MVFASMIRVFLELNKYSFPTFKHNEFSLDYIQIKMLTKKTQATRVNYGIEM